MENEKELQIEQTVSDKKEECIEKIEATPTETTEVIEESTESEVKEENIETEVKEENIETEVKEEFTEEVVETEEKKESKKKIDINININESLKDIEQKVKKSDIYAQLKQMFTKIKMNDYEFTLTKRDQWVILGIVFGLVFFDQVTKIIASNLLMEYESYEIIDNFFYFTFLYNPGMAWGTFSGMRWIFVLITPIILLGVTYFFVYSKKHEILTRAGMILVFAGAIGNWIDRLFIGEVRDFIHFIIPIINYDFPVFNIADIAVCVGMGLVIIEIIIQEYQIWKLSKSL